MKKALSLLLAAVMLLAMALPVCAAGTKTETLLDQINSKKEVTVVLQAGNGGTDTVYIKGNKLAYDYQLGFLTARIVVVDNVAYGYLPLLPFFYIKIDNAGLANVDLWQLIKLATGITTAVLNYVKTETVTEDGVTYTVEEFNDRATVTSRFYYVGDTLKKLVVHDSSNGSTQVTNFESISLSAPDSAFAVPTGFDLSVLLSGLFSAGLSELLTA
ncbi:MAG: hypothetical protein IJK64_08735 [Clostridia bacterium]|nr:hypothetical protein [Clostridia bacterium]